jgi:hypothetical protein
MPVTCSPELPPNWISARQGVDPNRRDGRDKVQRTIEIFARRGE